MVISEKDQTELALAIGRYFLIWGEIELRVHQLLSNLDVAAQTRDDQNIKSLRRRIDKILAHPRLANIHPEHRESIETAKKQLDKQSNTRNVIAHNPLRTIHIRKGENNIEKCIGISAINDPNKYVTFDLLCEQTLEAQKLSKELHYLLTWAPHSHAPE